MKKIKNWLKKNKKEVFLLLIISVIGIFLRTYHFHDWMRFSMDQSRDAGLISNAINGKAPLPTLGPDAGNTDFLLGPMYYDLSFISAKIFGNYPDKMAYPSLLAGILAIPFMFFFLREYFSRNISMGLVAILSVSYFMIAASRFSSNPNLIPIFVLLFLWGLLRILNDPKKFHPGWSALAGFSLGMGIQMHAITLVVMPAVGSVVILYLWKKGGWSVTWKSFLIAIAIALIFNIGQISSEWHTNFKNTHNFFQGLRNKSENNYVEGVKLISVCQVEANGYILSSIGADYDCGSILKKHKRKWDFNNIRSISFFIYLIFSVVGYYFLIRRFFKKEGKDERKKNFLSLVLLFNAATFIVMMSVSSVIHVEYFIILFFVPFVLLGILVEEVRKKINRMSFLWVWLIIGFLILSSLLADKKMAISYADGSQNNSDNSTLSQGEAMANYVLETLPQGTTHIYFTGKRSIAKRYHSPIEYFVEQVGFQISLKKSTDSDEIPAGYPLYYVSKTSSYPENVISHRKVISFKKFFNQTIYILEN